jgi:quercetin dioxygenase-like cupin family protein
MPAHWHPRAEYATILTGALQIGMGEKEDSAALQLYAAGSFFVMPPKMPHYGKSQDETIIELSGPGPYEVVFVNPADDPRKK